MRVAFFSPLPPSPSGIADYSEALLKPLRQLLDVDVFSAADPAFDATRYDLVLYQLGNNPHHEFVYETALRHPGVVVMHESNLHHLVADVTIKRGDWDAYMREVEYNGDANALAYATRVRALEVGPDYEGLPMTRRVLESATGVIVHSQFMVREMRRTGYSCPLAHIHHGAWIPEVDRFAYRERLGIQDDAPLIGIFGHLKPYKRIAESLRAFRRLVRVEPRAKLILVGARHPNFSVDSLIRMLDIASHVRVLGFTPIEDFAGYIAASDIVLNLRYPTVGETSGSLLRALGLGRAVIVSDIGAFAELPDDVCLKAPVGPGEEDALFEYLNVLAMQPSVARQLGDRARSWVERECSWDAVAQRYASFLCAVKEGREWEPSQNSAAAPDERANFATLSAGATGSESSSNAEPLELEYVLGWAPDDAARDYVETHKTRLVRTLEIIPPGGPDDRILEMGAYLQMTPALHSKLGYGTVRGAYYGPLGRVDRREAVSAEGEHFVCEIDHFDAEKDIFPYPDDYFSTVLCCELIEHLFHDPMHLMAEVNRILKPGGQLVLTTPNIASLRGISAILQGYHPGVFHSYIRPSAEGESDARHNREYTPREIHNLLENSGFSVTLLETGPYHDEPTARFGWVLHLLEHYKLDTVLRGEGIYAVGQKTGGVRERYPAWLYS